jgi:alkylhydroperoxidase/carboxymuconolactone decarboxylase family protein YurZ
VSDIPVVLDEIKRHFDLPQPPALFARLADQEPYLATSWHKFKTVLGGDGIDLPTKQLMGLAVAVAKANDYVIGLQRRELRRCGLGARDELEALAVAEFFEGFDSFAHALHVDSDLRPRRLAAGDMSLIDREFDVNVPYVIESADATVRSVYGEIRQAMGISFVPNIFKVLGHQPAMLAAKWESYKRVMGPGTLRRLTKELIAVAVSAVHACFY